MNNSEAIFDWKLVSTDEVFDPKITYELSENDLEEERKEANIYTLTNPTEFFELFFTEEVIDNIIRYTNQNAENYNANKEAKIDDHMKPWYPVTRPEMKAYFAMIIHMGITSCSELPLYWSKSETFRVNGIARVLPRDRFFKIKQFIYFNEIEEGKKGKDALKKLRMLFDSVSEACRNHWLPRHKLTIDESMVAFCGENQNAVHVARKPTPNGFKMYVLSDDIGYAIRFFPSFGRPNDTVEKIVGDLLESDFLNKGFHVFMDKFFTFFSCIIYLDSLPQ